MKDCIKAMASLTRRQMMGLCGIISYEEYFSDPKAELRHSAAWRGAAAWEYFRILANLAPALKRKALSDTGLPFMEMPSQAQCDYLAMMFRRRGVGALAAAPTEAIHVLQGHRPATGLGPNGIRAWLSFTYLQGRQTYASGGV